MSRIYLIGYMGVGKSTIGRKLSDDLNYSYIDLDLFIEARYHKTVPDLFSSKGEDEFRQIEQRMLKEVSQIEDVVISTGGGTPCFFDNMEMMNETGITVYIKATPEELAARLLASKNIRPIISGKLPNELIPFISEHLSQRERYYNRANIVYISDRLITKNQVYLSVEDIIEALKSKL